MILLALLTLSCIGGGVGIAALASLPLYWGLLAGWVCPAVVGMLVMPAYIVIERIVTAGRRHRDTPPVILWREQREGECVADERKPGMFG